MKETTTDKTYPEIFHEAPVEVPQEISVLLNKRECISLDEKDLDGEAIDEEARGKQPAVDIFLNPARKKEQTIVTEKQRGKSAEYLQVLKWVKCTHTCSSYCGTQVYPAQSCQDCLIYS